MTPIRGVIFDLDDTLFDCTGQLTEPARHRAAVILHEHIPDQTIDQLVEQQSDLSDRVGSTQAIHDIGTAYHLADSIVESAANAYNQEDVGPIEPFPDVIGVIDALSERSLSIFLVTTGRKNRQLAKVEELGLSSFFVEGENLLVHEPGAHPDKSPSLSTAMKSMGLEPCEILSVGDKLDADVSVGNRLGFVTARLRHGRQKDWSPRTEDEHPDHDLQTLTELLHLTT